MEKFLCFWVKEQDSTGKIGGFPALFFSALRGKVESRDKTRLLGMSSPKNLSVKSQLFNASQSLTLRGLTSAAKWFFPRSYFKRAAEQASTIEGELVLEPEAIQEPTQYILAKTLFDCREYERCAFHLAKCTGNQAIFLRTYSLYLAGEKLKNEESLERSGEPGAVVVNKHVKAVRAELEARRAAGTADAFQLYL